MSSLLRLGLGTLLAAATLSDAGCMKGETAGPAGKAGTSGAANTAGTAGATGTGPGTSGTTGAGPGTSGTTGTGPGTSGTTGTGPGTAGTTGTSGTSGSAGTSGTTNTLPATFAYLFNTSVEGWSLNNYADTSRKNLAAPDAGSAATLTHDAATGEPAAGSLRATASFTDWKQYIDAAINFSPVKNLPGRVLRARVKLVSGSFGGGAQLHAGTGSGYRFAASAWTTLTVGNWVELVLDLDAAKAGDAMFDPTMVIQVGVKFDTGGDNLTTPFGNPIDSVFQIDTVSDGVVGGVLPPAVSYSFDANVQGFVVSDYANATRTNLGAPGSAALPVLSWDSADGNPAGSLKLTATFSDYKQYADAVINLSSVDLTGKMLHAFVRLDSGAFLGGVQMHIGTGASYAFTAGTWTTLNVGSTWTELVLDVAAATTPADVRQIGFQFDTGDVEAGTFGSPVDAVFHIDGITVQ